MIFSNLKDEMSVRTAGLKQTIAFIVLVIWLVSSAFAFWWFQFQHMESYDNYAASFDGELLSQSELKPKQGYALVIHFIDPDCPCSRFSKKHIQDLESHFGPDVEFVSFTNKSLEDQYRPRFSQLSVPASPAVAIWDRKGKLAYMGPYSSGNLCGQGRDFVKKVLGSLEDNINPFWINQNSIGCFCEWSLS